MTEYPIRALDPKIMIWFRDGRVKEYEHRGVMTGQMMEIEYYRGRLYSERDPFTRSTLFKTLYQKQAQYYLIDPDTGQGMTEYDFFNTEWNDVGIREGIRKTLDQVNQAVIQGKDMR